MAERRRSEKVIYFSWLHDLPKAVFLSALVWGVACVAVAVYLKG